MKIFRVMTFMCVVSAGMVLHAQELQGPVKDPFESGALLPAPAHESFRPVPDPKGRPYFPEGEAYFYTKYLAAMKEPSVMDHQAEDPAFELRFTWIRCRHDPVVVRVWNDGHSQKVRAVKLTVKEDGKPGSITKDVTRNLTPEEWKEIVRLTDMPAFWKPLTEDEEKGFSEGCDGAIWLFERRNPAKYDAIDVWSPKFMMSDHERGMMEIFHIRDLTPYIRFGEYLLRITALTPAAESELY